MFITFSVRASRVGTKATAIYKVGDGCLPATHKTIGPYQKIQMLTYGCLEGVWGQGTLELIKVGRFVIQVRLKSTGQESKCLGAQLQLPGEGCRVGAGAHSWRGTHVYAGAGQAPQ